MVQFDYWNEEWRLTQILSLARRPQSLPTSMAVYQMDQVLRSDSEGIRT